VEWGELTDRPIQNFNGLLRQCLPKGTDLSIHSHAHVARVMEELNTRPRKLLGYRTPKQAMKAEPGRRR